MYRYEPAKAPTANLIPTGVAGPDQLSPAQPEARRWRPPRATWAFELFCAFVSIAAIIAIAAVLRTYDGQVLTTWELRVTINSSSINISLNSVIAILGTVAKSTIAVVLSSGLSQNKWDWYSRRQRPLQDFELFDSASRGPRGSIQLLWRTRARRIASLGAFLTILSLTFDPFLQLLISYPGVTQPFPDASATLPYAQSYHGGSEIGLDSLQVFGPDGKFFDGFETSTDPMMMGAMYSALWNMETRLKPTYTCENGNCTWPPYVSLAVCSSCYDLSDQLTKSNPTNISYGSGGASIVDPTGNLMYSLGSNALSIVNADGFSADFGGTAMNTSVTFYPNRTFNFQQSQTLLLALAAMVTNQSFFANKTAWEDTPVTAVECGLLLCANTYNSSVQNGNYSEKIMESNSQRVPSSWSVEDPAYDNETSYIFNGTLWNPIGLATVYHVNRTDFQVQLTAEQDHIADGATFGVPQSSLDALVFAIHSMLGPSTGNDSFSTVIMDSGIVRYDTPAMEALWSGTSISAIFANLATDMSAIMRSASNSSDADADDGTIGGASRSAKLAAITGMSVQFNVLIAVRWAFFVVPALICGMGVLFLVAAILETRGARTPIWKDHALPGLVWGLDDETRRRVRNQWLLTGKAGDRNMVVVYRGGKEGGELVQ